MDLQAALICIGVALLSAVIIYVISVFSMREKTYEEAIAEQRKMPEEHLLLGRSSKDKTKEKKLKKLGKKVKEKTTESEKNIQTDASIKSTQSLKHEEIRVKSGSETTVKEEIKVPLKVNKVENSLGTNKQESVPKVLSAKTENNPVQKERTVAVKNDSGNGDKEKRSGEKDKNGEAKQEKIPLKSDKNAVGKTEKIPAPKSEKQVSVKTEKVAIVKADKNTVKTDKAVAEKSEKIIKDDKSTKIDNVPSKQEKIQILKTEKGEKGIPAKIEKNSAKAEKPPANKGDKGSAVQEICKTKNVSSTLNTASAANVPAATVQQSGAASGMKHEVAQTQTVNPPKEKTRKKKSELAALQQMTGERDGVNVSLLLPLVQKAELSRSEIQILIDHLLNKQQNAGVSDAEWIEGRQDPVVKLKKQLAEKEKALQEEQEASHGVQAKLKELRLELNSERSRHNHAHRQLEENLTAKTTEAQNLATRLQHIQETANNEKQALNLQLQQLQQKFSEEHMRLLQLQEQESVLQQDLVARQQQLDVRISHFTENENTLNAQITQLMGQLKEEETISANLKVEIQNLRDQHVSDNTLLHERVAHAEKQLVLYEENAERAQELLHQVEELNHVRGELEHRLGSIQKHEANLQYEVNSLRSEIDELKAQLIGYETLKNEANSLRSDNDKLSSQLVQNKELQMENQRLLDENEHLTSQLVGLPELQREALQLREENETLAAQVTAMTDRPAAEGRENGDLQLPEEKQDSHTGDFTQFEKIIQQKEGQLLQMAEDLEKKSTLIVTLESEVNMCKSEVGKLGEELEEQKKRNNDLRIKNWKVMEALSSMEKSLQNKMKESSPDLVSEAAIKAKEEEQLMIKQLLQRMFPNVQVEGGKTHSQWLENFEHCIKNMFSGVSPHPTEMMQSVTSHEDSSDFAEMEKQNNYLQGLVSNYKIIIDDTEGMLKKLQNQVEEGEIRWRQQMQVKEAELETVRQELEAGTKSTQHPGNNSETQKQFEDLQAKVELQTHQKQDIEEKYSKMCSHIEEMKEEHSRLSVQLKKEEEKTQDLTKELVKLRSLVQIGKDSFSQEHEMVVQLQQQVDKLNGVHQNHNVATNGPSTETSSLTEGGSGKK